MGVLGVNHIAFRSPDPQRLREFYAALLGAEPLQGEHDPLRAGSIVLAFFSGAGPIGDDEIAFDVDRRGFEEALDRAAAMGLEVRGPVDHGPSSRGLYLTDPDGRRVELTQNDPGVHWRG